MYVTLFDSGWPSSGAAPAEFLSQASLLEHDFTVELLSDIMGSSPSTVQTLVDRAADVHVLGEYGPVL